MTEAEVFVLADQALNNVIQQIGDDQWTLGLPQWFGLGRTQDRSRLDLRAIINYHAYDEAWVPETLAGKTIQAVGDKYDGDILGDDPKAAYAKLHQRAVAAVRALDDPAQTVHLSYGDWPAREYLKHITSFRAFRACDLARLIGASTQLPEPLVQGLWEMLVPEVEEWRQMGVYGPAVAVPAEAPPQERLLGLVGRDPAGYR